jgi:hypothetical protein
MLELDSERISRARPQLGRTRHAADDGDPEAIRLRHGLPRLEAMDTTPFPLY